MKERVLARAQERAATQEKTRWQERAAAVRLLAELMALPAERRRQAVETEPRFSTLGLVDRLLALAGPPVLGTVSEAVDLALAALRHLDPQLYGEPALTGRELIARCLEADARRREGDAAGAESRLHALTLRLAEESIDGPERGVFCRCLAFLRSDQGWYDEAVALLLRAAKSFEEWREPGAAGEALAERGWLCLAQADLASAMGDFETALKLLEGSEWKQAAVRAWHGLAVAHADLGERAEAERAFASALALHKGSTGGAETPWNPSALIARTYEELTRSRLPRAADPPAEEQERRGPWKILAHGRSWSGEELPQRLALLPEKLEIFQGRLLWSDEERKALLAMLLENVGADEAVRLAPPAVWSAALARLAPS